MCKQQYTGHVCWADVGALTALDPPPTPSGPVPHLGDRSGHLANGAITQRCMNGYSAFVAVAVLQKE